MPSDELEQGQAIVEQVRSMAAATDSGEFGELQTIPEVLAFTIAHARAEGLDEVVCVLAVVLAADVSRADLRHARDVLRRLGYIAVATELGELARKSRPNRSSKPVPRQHKR